MSALLDGNGLSLLGALVFIVTMPIATLPMFFILERLIHP